MGNETMSKFMNKQVLLALCWGVGGSLTLVDRQSFSRKIGNICQAANCISGVNFDGQLSTIDWQVKMDDGNFQPWNQSVPEISLNIN